MLRAKMIRDDAADAFWAFSLAVYAEPGVAPLCLELQARHGLDVNLLLLGAWVGASGRGRLEADDLARLAEEVAPLNREVVAPLRAVRTSLKAMLARAPELGALRDAVKASELEAERMVQRRLAARLALQPQPSGAQRHLTDAGANIAACLDRFGILHEDGRAHVLRVFAAAIAATAATLDRPR